MTHYCDICVREKKYLCVTAVVLCVFVCRVCEEILKKKEKKQVEVECIEFSRCGRVNISKAIRLF